MNRRKIFGLSAFAALALALAAANAGPAGAADEPDSDWTVVTMSYDGSWGVGTAISTNQAISMAFANCKRMSKKEIGCGAHTKTMRSGWILANRCGREIILVADANLKDAEHAATAREIELRQVYARDMLPCKRILAVNPYGIVARENLEISRRVLITDPTKN